MLKNNGVPGGGHEFDPNCLECSLSRRLASETAGNVPESVWSVFEAAAGEQSTGWLARLPAVLRLATLPLSVAGQVGTRLLGLVPARITEDEKLRAAGERLLEAAVAYVTAGGYLERLPAQPRHHHHARYTCEFNITQYGEQEEIEEGEDEEEEEGGVDAVDGGAAAAAASLLERKLAEARHDSVKDILVLELSAELESEEAVSLPSTQAEAIRFQTENLAAAVMSSSAALSRAMSRESSRGPASAMGSRAPSLSSLHSGSSGGGSPLSLAASIDGPAADTIELLRQVSERQESLMAFYYLDADHQVRMTEIFDVTEAADPALLRAAAAAAATVDDLGIDYSAKDLLTDQRRSSHNSHLFEHDHLAHSHSSPGGLTGGGGRMRAYHRHHSSEHQQPQQQHHVLRHRSSLGAADISSSWSKTQRRDVLGGSEDAFLGSNAQGRGCDGEKGSVNSQVVEASPAFDSTTPL
jgi:hypothetical protein